jgi:exo-beta-1,3-glucanase (GH17 family)
MRFATTLFALTAAGIIAVWAWLGASVQMPPSPFGAGEKLHCISYAPFRAGQDPFGPDIPIDPRQIDEDLAQLKQIANCIRTYSVDHGLDQIPEIARKHGLKVMQGLWLSSLPDLSRKQVDGAIALANRYPDVIQAVVVGNEVLLRGEMSAPALAQTIRQVKAQVPMPVTYADVWEFWLRNRDLVAAVDFITIHILPYWEDVPIPAREAARHVDAIRKQVMAAFPGKEVLVGEFGWPSAGRMREGALPSRVNQARTLHEVLAQARREDYRVNVIEAYDQPWKRKLEGTVGGHWGLFDAYRRLPKFTWGTAVSNHPGWRWQAAVGIGLAVCAFAAAWLAAPRRIPPGVWLRIAAGTLVSGVAAGLTIENVVLESLTLGDWVRSLAWAGAALLAPVIVAAAMVSERSIPSFVQMLGRSPQRPRRCLACCLGILFVLVVVFAIQSALGLVFEPRYRDLPFAPMLGTTIPLLLATSLDSRPRGQRPTAQTLAAWTLIVAAVYIAFNETFANWQAMWLCVGFIALAVTLLRVRDAPS